MSALAAGRVCAALRGALLRAGAAPAAPGCCRGCRAPAPPAPPASCEHGPAGGSPLSLHGGLAPAAAAARYPVCRPRRLQGQRRALRTSPVLLAVSPQQDHYGALSVARTATADQIKRAYLRLAKKLHPDVSGKSSADQFAAIHEAYKVLSDPQKRQVYDMSGGGFTTGGAAAGPEGQTAQGFNQWGEMNFNYGGVREGPNVGQGMGMDMGRMWEDLFSQNNAQQAKRSQKYQAQKGGDITVKLRLGFLEAVEGCKKEVSYHYLRKCAPCKGSGSKDGAPRVRCNVCHGRGKQTTTNGYYHIEQPCAACGGSGEIVHAMCPSCGGKGVVKDRTSQQVQVPAGVDSHDRLRVAGKGEAGLRGGPTGHLYCDIDVEEHPVFERDGDDIHVVLPILLSQAVLGGKVSLPTLAGEVQLTVPAGTQQGDKVLLRGKGVKKPQQNKVGDQYVHFHVTIPKTITAEQRIAVERFAEQEDKTTPPPELFRELKRKYRRSMDIRDRI
eukprot:TRINITY_DN11273_c0_g1_i1.p1 TRINITY_DN11273_c0_g1~~TRINITY_DN11273_c0_g1_i1.p1  ORF type:complete len:498 (+),score=161.06 TRINITY_DN11273_c0_g1_i1:68-1561(+)